jgi:hypothetical protein
MSGGVGRARALSLRSIVVGSMNDANNRHATALGVNPVDHAVGTAADAVSVIERPAKALTHPVRVSSRGPTRNSDAAK